MPITPRKLLRATQVVLALAVLGFATREIVRQWSAVRPLVASLHPAWGLMVVSAIIVLATYGLLIAVWRFMLHAWGDELSVRDAARIWFVSNLGKYVPGKVWQITAMGVMARGRGVSPAAAVGSSLVINLANVITGFGLVLLTGASILGVTSSNPELARRVAVVMVVLGALALVLLPALLPLAVRLAGRLLGRPVALPRLPPSTLWAAVVGTFVAWVMYGLAFRLFTFALLNQTTGGTSAYLAVYTGSYLVGYLTLISPGGVGVREVVLANGMQQFGLAGAPAATVVAWASRLWLSVLEILPGVVFLVLRARAPATTIPDDATP